MSLGLGRAHGGDNDPANKNAIMATYNPGHGGGGGGSTTAAHHHNAAVPAVAAGGPSHALPLAGASIHGNGAVSMDVFDQELNFDESLL